MNNTTVTEILSGHVSPETAYIVNDYPYGFRLRCKIRYWLEHHPKRGTRFVSQTTNPKKSALVDIWNKPKASTYSDVGAMYLDEQGHVQWSTASFSYDEASVLAAWLAEFGFSLPDEVRAKADGYLAVKRVYESEKARGEFPYQICAEIATLHVRAGKPLEELRAKYREVAAAEKASNATAVAVLAAGTTTP